MAENTPFRTACAVRGARLALAPGETHEEPSGARDRLLMVTQGSLSLLRSTAKKPLILAAGDVLTLPAKASFTLTASDADAHLLLF